MAVLPSIADPLLQPPARLSCLIRTFALFPGCAWSSSRLPLRDGSIGDTMPDPVNVRAPFGSVAWEETMPDSLYKVIEIIGTSPQSWDLAAKSAVERAAKTLRELRVAEVVEQDIEIRNGKLEQYRVKLKVSFKYEDDDKQ